MNRAVAPGFGETFRLTLITADPALAAQADAAGVDRVGVDLEVIGKRARQPLPGARISSHSVTDLKAVAAALSRSRAFVRINPPHAGSQAEVETVLTAGAQEVMLPYFQSCAEAEWFVRLVDGRARAILLIETRPALADLGEIVSVGGVDEVMLGLNDLRLVLGMRSHFEVLTSSLTAAAAEKILKAGLAFSAGGVARPDDRGLPFDPDLVLAQYPRLGATGAWLSRSFLARTTDAGGLASGVRAIRARLEQWTGVPPEQLEDARVRLEAEARRA